jgi:acyl carrier protein
VTDAVLEALRAAVGRVAPGADLDAIDADADLREQLDIDSIDFLRVVQGLHEILGVDVPEADYGRLDTLARSRAYLAERLAGAQDTSDSGARGWHGSRMKPGS